jgi:peptidoglycan/LPS O-acetylase OafA/YrhL
VSVDLRIGDYSHLAVIVFFVISGFLITRLMLQEYTRNGQVSLKRFYARRTLRLFPALYAYIACVCLLWLAGVLHLHARDIWHSITYTVNFLPARAKPIGHLWSLSNEEQFYLLWPCAFVLLGPRRSGWLAVATILFGPVARASGWLFLRGTPYYDLPMCCRQHCNGLSFGEYQRTARRKKLVSETISASLFGRFVGAGSDYQSLHGLHRRHGLWHVSH